MTISKPSPVLSEIDRQLLRMLGEMILSIEENGGDIGRNEPSESLILNSDDASSLLNLLEAYFEQRSVREAVEFVEIIAGGRDTEEKAAREIYLSARKRRGRQRAMASHHWSDFQLRLGINWHITRGTFSKKMEFNYFKEMELRLLSVLGVHPRVTELIVKYIESSKGRISEIRDGIAPIKEVAIRRLISQPLSSFRQSGVKAIANRPISQGSLVALTTLVADTSVLFTTRDWSVTGTLSTMCAASTQLVSGD